MFDDDPEDAYDVADPPDIQADVLERVAADLRARRADGRFAARRSEALRVLERADIPEDIRTRLSDDLRAL